MKIRDGFVANSSSTAFLLCGVKLTQKQCDKLYKLWEKADYNDDVAFPGLSLLTEELLFGVLVDIDEESGEITPLSSRKDMKPESVSKKISALLGKEVEAQFFTGVRAT